MTLVIPNFELSDVGSRSLNPKFLLDSRLGSSQGVLQYSDAVRHATRMLSESNDRKIFVDIAKILAFGELLRGGIGRIRPIGSGDIADLSIQQRELN